MKRFVKMVNGRKSLTIITKYSIMDVAAVLDPPLGSNLFYPFHANSSVESSFNPIQDGGQKGTPLPFYPL